MATVTGTDSWVRRTALAVLATTAICLFGVAPAGANGTLKGCSQKSGDLFQSNLPAAQTQLAPLGATAVHVCVYTGGKLSAQPVMTAARKHTLVAALDALHSPGIQNTLTQLDPPNAVDIHLSYPGGKHVEVQLQHGVAQNGGNVLVSEPAAVRRIRQLIAGWGS